MIVPAHVIKNGELILVLSLVIKTLADLEKRRKVSISIPGQRGRVACIIEQGCFGNQFIELTVIPPLGPIQRMTLKILEAIKNIAMNMTKKDTPVYLCSLFTPTP